MELYQAEDNGTHGRYRQHIRNNVQLLHRNVQQNSNAFRIAVCETMFGVYQNNVRICIAIAKHCSRLYYWFLSFPDRIVMRALQKVNLNLITHCVVQKI